ncbi:phosphatidylinositol-4- kinase, partial [Quaeritorhiza haematococci]
MTTIKTNQDAFPHSDLQKLTTLLSIVSDSSPAPPPSCSPSSPRASEDLVNLFRDFWFYMVLFVMDSTTSGSTSSGSDGVGAGGMWPREWRGLLESVAKRTPPLVLGRRKRSLRAELEGNSVMNAKFSEGIIAKARTNLSLLLRSRTGEIKSLAPCLVVYLLAVVSVEKLRIQGGDGVECMFEYLVDERNGDIADLLEGLCKQVFDLHLQTLKHTQNFPTITHHIRLVLLHATHRSKRVRRFCYKQVAKVTSEYRGFLWDRGLVWLMIDLLLSLDGKGGAAGTREAKAIAQLKQDYHLQYIDAAEQQAASQDFLKLCSLWIECAVKQSSKDMSVLIQGYLSRSHSELPGLASMETSQLVLLFTRFCSEPAVVADIFRSLGKQAHYMGRIRGMIDVLQMAESSKDPPDLQSTIFTKVSTMMKEDLQKWITSASKSTLSLNTAGVEGGEGEGAGLEHLAFTSALYMSAALLLIMEQIDEELLHLVCWAPIASFSPATMEVAVPVWTWLMSGRPSIALKVLSNLLAVWETTIARSQGLFQPNTESGNPFLHKMTYTPSRPASEEQDPVEAHAVWINFLNERFEVMRYGKRDTLLLFAKLYHISHIHSGSFRLTSAARHPRFRLLLLGLKIVQELEAHGELIAPFLRYAVYEDAFRWFAAPAMWGHNPQELKSLTEFLHTVRSSSGGTAIRSILSSESTPKFAKLALGAASSRVELVDAHQILQMMLDNERARMMIWHHPLDDNGNVGAAPSDKTTKWVSIIRTAWAIDPHLAIQFRARFPSAADTIGQELTDLVCLSAQDVVDSPEALNLLVANELKDDSEFRHLLHWAAIPPITAIALLGRQTIKSQPWVLQYALRVLEFFPVDLVFFYIPQMVQALRYDGDSGYVEHFILNTAKTSQLFAHQIIWNMNANMYKDGEGEVPDKLKPTLDRVIAKIVAGLSGTDKEFYEREFGFFAEVTGISGKLKPYIQKTKAEKKRKIDEEMRKIKVDPGVYLPSNPESTVIDIDYDSGRPLQSHAK